MIRSARSQLENNYLIYKDGPRRYSKGDGVLVKKIHGRKLLEQPMGRE